MGKRQHKPTDPAEIARRRLPKGSDVAVGNLSLPANRDIHIEPATRLKVARVTRYDAFALLHVRGSLSDAHVAAVRRLEGDIAIRFGLEGRRDVGVVVDCQSSAEGTTVRQLKARDRLNEALAKTGSLSARLLCALCEPSVQCGQPVNNWRKVVEAVTGEHLNHAQTAAVRMACENLAVAFIEIDNGAQRAA